MWLFCSIGNPKVVPKIEKKVIFFFWENKIVGFFPAIFWLFRKISDFPKHGKTNFQTRKCHP